jgi:hypothetical protein
MSTGVTSTGGSKVTFRTGSTLNKLDNKNITKPKTNNKINNQQISLASRK